MTVTFNSILKRILPAAVLLAGVLAAPRAHAAYPKLEWIYRLKPNAVPKSVVFLGKNILAAQSERNQLHLIDIETGVAVWEYGLDERADVYPLGEGSILAAAGGVLHRLDYANRKRAWSSPVCDRQPRQVFVSADEQSAAVQCPGAKMQIFDLAGGTRKTADAVPSDYTLAAPVHPAELNSSLLGPDTTLNIQGKNAVLYAGSVQSVVWSYTAAENLAPTAALLGDKLLLLTSAGSLIALDSKTGAEDYRIDLRKVIDMRFWDELPHRIDNYSASRIFTSGGAIFVFPPSGIAKLRIQPFPPEIKLGGSSSESTDTTQQWALNKAIQAWDRNDFNAALKAFGEAAQIWPDSPEVMMFMAMAHSALRDANPAYLDQSISELQRAWKLAPRNPDVVANLIGNLMLKALTLDQRADREKIIGLYRLMAASDPYSLVPLAGLAETYLMGGGAGDAATLMRESFNYGFFGPEQFNLLSAALYAQDEREEAVKNLDTTIQLYPSSGFAYIIKAKILSKDGKYAQSAKVFASAPSDPKQPRPEVSAYPRFLMSGERFFSANATGLSGRLPEAIKMFKDYLAWLPSEAELKDMKQKAGAAAETDARGVETSASFDARFKGRTYIELAAESQYRVPAMLALAQFMRMSGDTAGCMKQLDAADKAREKDDMDTVSFVGYNLALLGRDPARALKYTTEAYKASATDTVFAKNQAVALWKSGKTAEAEKLFKQTLALGRPTELLHYDFGIMLLDLKRFDEAEAQFKKEIEIAPELDAAKKALDSVQAARKKEEAAKKKKKKGK